jgi:hypothetical protein
MVKIEKAQEVTMDPAALELLALAEEKQMDTLWDRQEKMEPQCGYGELGIRSVMSRKRGSVVHVIIRS